MTKRQLEAIEWLESVGKATPKLLRRAGFAQRTFDTLVDDGFILRDHVRGDFGIPLSIYRPLVGRES